MSLGKLKIPVLIGFAGHATIVTSDSGDKELNIREPRRVLLEHRILLEIDEPAYIRMQQEMTEKLKKMGYEVLEDSRVPPSLAT